MLGSKGFCDILMQMLRSLPVLLIFLFAATMAQASDWYVTASEWARPRNGGMLIEMAELKQAVRLLTESSDNRLQVRYPGGDEGSLWASELKAWLIALGVESARIEILPGSDRSDAIQLLVKGE